MDLGLEAFHSQRLQVGIVQRKPADLLVPCHAFDWARKRKNFLKFQESERRKRRSTSKS